MTDKELETKLNRIFNLGENYGISGGFTGRVWRDWFQTMKQEIMLEFQKQQKESEE